MKLDLQDYARDLIRELNHVVETILRIPDAVFKNHGTAGFEVAMYERFGDKLQDSAVSAKLQRAKDGLQVLCEAAPHVRPEAIQSISIAYATVSMAFDEMGDDSSNVVDVSMLMSSSMMLGMAMGEISASPLVTDSDRTQMLSIAGTMGANAKHRMTRELKEWALAEAQKTPGDDKGVARKLVARIPTHLVNASKEPDRLIYEALRANRKRPAG